MKETTKPPTPEYTEINGQKTAYFRYNTKAKGMPILYIHGYNGTGLGISYIAPYLKEHPIYAPDWPGAGLSDKPQDPGYYYPSKYTDFFIKFMQKMGIEKAIIIGHSLGGRLASHLAYRAPDKTPLLILIDPYGFAVQDDNFAFQLSKFGPLVDLAFSFNNYDIAKNSIENSAFTSKEAVPPDYRDYILSALFQHNANDSLKLVTKYLIHRDYLDNILPGIKQPVLLLWGREDKVMKIIHAHEFTSRLGIVYFYSIEGQNHMPHIEQPQKIAEYIKNFLKIKKHN
ncbi:alpha/beta hydrolase [Spirochaetia bacterium 38H-sp]|uniref:Alpha/beta hydrolase n=1 Tax=Rarispira pelagica TaxID=3141764 RepID=A0ABU9UDT1_9SPIR